jgi:cytochrome P450
MFSSVLFGCLTKTSSPQTEPEDMEFCNASMEAVEAVFPLMTKPHLRLLLKLGFKTVDCKRFEDNLTVSRSIANAKLETLRRRKEQQDLTEAENSSYFSRSIDRLNAEPQLLSYEELAEIICFLQTASVATTSSILNWCIVHLAMNPVVQDELYQEISSNVKNSKEGQISEAMLSKVLSPFLHAVIRESHRMTPATCLSLLKSNTQADVELHGYNIPKGSMILLDTY